MLSVITRTKIDLNLHLETLKYVLGNKNLNTCVQLANTSVFYDSIHIVIILSVF